MGSSASARGGHMRGVCAPARLHTHAPGRCTAVARDEPSREPSGRSLTSSALRTSISTKGTGSSSSCTRRVSNQCAPRAHKAHQQAKGEGRQAAVQRFARRACGGLGRPLRGPQDVFGAQQAHSPCHSGKHEGGGEAAADVDDPQWRWPHGCAQLRGCDAILCAVAAGRERLDLVRWSLLCSLARSRASLEASYIVQHQGEGPGHTVARSDSASRRTGACATQLNTA